MSCLEYYLSSEYRGEIIAAILINISYIPFVKITVHDLCRDLRGVEAQPCDSRLQLVCCGGIEGVN
jgi:hypothetical protein